MSPSVRKFTPLRVALAIRKRLSSFERLRRKGRIVVGIASYGTPTVETYLGDDNTRLLIGNYCSIASSAVFLLGGNHPLDRRSTFPVRLRLMATRTSSDGFPSSKGDIIVGHGAWIGYGAIILSGVTIGNGAVVAAGAVVARDVAPYTIIAGNPARTIRQRLSADEMEACENSAWWNWSRAKVATNASYLNDEIVL